MWNLKKEIFLIIDDWIKCFVLFIIFLQQKNLGEVKQLLRETPLEDNKKRELSTALHVYFKDWLYGNDPYYIKAC